MTDEEMAEEYSKSACAWIEDREPLDEIDIQQAFLAGLNAGRPEWHDLRKDPNDLPKGHKVVLNQVGAATTYDPNRGFLGLDGCGIIAWTEIPIFNKD